MSAGGRDAGDKDVFANPEVEVGFGAHWFDEFDLRDERGGVSVAASLWHDRELRYSKRNVEVFRSEPEHDGLGDVIGNSGGEIGS